jgi:hypothetical protein
MILSNRLASGVLMSVPMKTIDRSMERFDHQENLHKQK